MVGEENYYYMKEFNPGSWSGWRKSAYVHVVPWASNYGNYLKPASLHLDFILAAYSNNRQRCCKTFGQLWTDPDSHGAHPVLLGYCLLGGVLGVLAGWKPGSLFDRITTPVFLFLNTVPTNCVGVVFLVVFAFRLKLFPLKQCMTSGGLVGMARFWDIVWHAALPVIILVLFRTSSNFLLMKSNVSQIKDEDYTVTARSKGLPERRILFRHVLKKCHRAYVTSLCIQVGSRLSDL
ncbi:MAG: ABC transporter permease subunit [Oscillospiraceae bacterium]